MICFCTLYTRAAIEAGVNADIAFTLSDAFINKIEEIGTGNELMSLEYKMLEKFMEMILIAMEHSYSPNVKKAIIPLRPNGVYEKKWLN